MKQRIAAVRSGSDPVVALPSAAFHRWLEDPIICQKCDATYNLVVDWDWSNDRFFEEESRQMIRLLRKAIWMSHGEGHRASHFETSGVIVVRHVHPSTSGKADAIHPKQS
jgi:hypothetical protein